MFRISIHAPRMGSDNGIYGTQAQDVIFQSTLPEWGATLAQATGLDTMTVFQSTLPEWGATIAVFGVQTL